MAQKKLNKLGVENSLWNNIRAKKGSGKKPTKEMLEQEKKIKKFEDGGYLKFNQKQANPFIQAPFTQGTTPEGFAFDWMNSPEYQGRLSNMGYSNPEQITQQRLDNLTNFDLSIGRGKSVANPATEYSKASVHLNPNEIKNTGYNTLLSHELGHIIGATPGMGVKDPTKSSSFTGYTPAEESFINRMNINPAKNFHDEKPYEMKADLYSNRYKMFEEGIYDIRQGNPFTIDDLNRAKEKLKNDESFRRLLEQTGDENYIEMMNTIAMQNQQPAFGMDNSLQFQAAYGGYINPMQSSQDQYFLGSMLGSGTTPGSGSGVTGMASGLIGSIIPTQNKDGNTSIGGSAAKGALSGISAGAAFGPIGMGVGAVLGGAAGFFGGKKAQKTELAEQELLAQQQKDDSTRAALAQMNFSNSSNLPMAYGGAIPNSMDVPLGSFNDFPVGGTHESNPNGGIPQGTNANGQLRTVEAGEGKFRFPQGDYIFSNRLKFE